MTHDSSNCGAAQRPLLNLKQTVKLLLKLARLREACQGAVWPDSKHTHIQTYAGLQQKSRWANLLLQHDQAGPERQRLHGAQSDAVEKYWCWFPLRQTPGVCACVSMRVRKCQSDLCVRESVLVFPQAMNEHCKRTRRGHWQTNNINIDPQISYVTRTHTYKVHKPTVGWQCQTKRNVVKSKDTERRMWRGGGWQTGLASCKGGYQWEVRSGYR